MACLSRPYTFKLFRGCLPQILLRPFLNTLSYLMKNLFIIATLFCECFGTLRCKLDRKMVFTKLCKNQIKIK